MEAAQRMGVAVAVADTSPLPSPASRPATKASAFVGAPHSDPLLAVPSAMARIRPGESRGLNQPLEGQFELEPVGVGGPSQSIKSLDSNPMTPSSDSSRGRFDIKKEKIWAHAQTGDANLT